MISQRYKLQFDSYLKQYFFKNIIERILNNFVLGLLDLDLDDSSFLK